MSTLPRAIGNTPLYEAERRALTSAEQETVNRRIEAFRILMQRPPMAGYRLEVQFNSNYRSQAQALSGDPLIQGVVSFWRNATDTGRGEEKVYECPGKFLKRSSCDKLIPMLGHGFGVVVCPHCGTKWKPEQVTGEVLHNRTRRGWADVLYHYMTKMDGDADIVLKHPTESDIRTATARERDHDRGGEVLRAAREKRNAPDRIVRYQLKNFIKDVGAGADPLERLYAFVSA
jgi:hypothetical protein